MGAGSARRSVYSRCQYESIWSMCGRKFLSVTEFVVLVLAVKLTSTTDVTNRLMEQLHAVSSIMRVNFCHLNDD